MNQELDAMIAELRAQRNQALDMLANAAARIAALSAALGEAQRRLEPPTAGYENVKVGDV